MRARSCLVASLLVSTVGCNSTAPVAAETNAPVPASAPAPVPSAPAEAVPIVPSTPSSTDPAPAPSSSTPPAETGRIGCWAPPLPATAPPALESGVPTEELVRRAAAGKPQRVLLTVDEPIGMGCDCAHFRRGGFDLLHPVVAAGTEDPVTYSAATYRIRGYYTGRIISLKEWSERRGEEPSEEARDGNDDPTPEFCIESWCASPAGLPARRPEEGDLEYAESLKYLRDNLAKLRTHKLLCPAAPRR